MAASQLSCHRSHCDHHSTRESRHNCLLSQITAHRNCVSIHNFSQRGITTRIEMPIMSRNVPNSCANLKSRIVPPVTFSSILPPSSEAYQALPCSPLDRRQRTPEGETYPASPLSSSKPPGSSQLSSPFSRPPGRIGVNIKFNRLHSKLHTSLNSSSAPGVSAWAGVVKSSS